MNEPSNFCVWPCTNPENPTIQEMELEGLTSKTGEVQARSVVSLAHSVLEIVKPVPRDAAGAPKRGLPGRDLTTPKYQIKNTWGAISNKTVDTDLIHQGGWAEYDTHNL